MNKIEEVKRDFEANLLDGDKINDCGGAMLSTKYIWEWLEPKLQEVRAETIRECIEALPKNRIGMGGQDETIACDEFRAKALASLTKLLD